MRILGLSMGTIMPRGLGISALCGSFLCREIPLFSCQLDNRLFWGYFSSNSRIYYFIRNVSGW